MRNQPSSLQHLYEDAAQKFAERIQESFGDAIHAVVLYGSVARKDAERNSDIDVMVLTDNGRPTRDDLVDISEAIDFENTYRTFVIATSFTPLRLRELARGGFPIASSILSEGVALYDDGTFERIRKTIAAGR
jgi:hypothetical protein